MRSGIIVRIAAITSTIRKKGTAGTIPAAIAITGSIRGLM